MKHLKTFEKISLDWIKDKIGIIDKSIKYTGKDSNDIDPFKEEDWGYAERERLKRIEMERIAELKRQREIERRRRAEEIRLANLKIVEEFNEKFKKYLESTPYRITEIRDILDSSHHRAQGKLYSIEPERNENFRFKIIDYHTFDRNIILYLFFNRDIDHYKIFFKNLEEAFEWIFENWKNPIESKEIKELIEIEKERY